MISYSFTGFVRRSSRVPLFFSSEINRMVIAGAKNRRRNGVVSKIVRREEILAMKMPLVKNHPRMTRKTTMTIYATGELKYERSSFKKMCLMFVKLILSNQQSVVGRCPQGSSALGGVRAISNLSEYTIERDPSS